MLTRSKDRKVANAVSPNGKTAVIGNAFGLPAGKEYACPGATSFCTKICYAGKLEKVYSGVKNVLVRNFQELVYADYLDGIDGMTNLISDMVQEFLTECDNRKAKGKNVSYDFRIHWDGDFFNRNYADAWANVIMAFPEIHFWVYTRSFTDDAFVIDILSDIDNLTVYLSADVDNIDIANAVAAEYPGVFIATVADTFAEARETIIDSSRKVYDCPENAKRIPLITDKGSACIRCGICVSGRGDVAFAVKKR